MRYLLFLLFLLVAQLLQVCVSSESEHTSKHVLFISIDGMRNTYINDALANPNGTIQIPNILSLVANGVLAKGAETVMPAFTYPAHTSMITGVNPNKHGIITNCYPKWREFGLSPEKICDDQDFFINIQTQSLISQASKKGMSVVGIDFPVTVGAPMEEMYPGNIGVPDNFQQGNWLYNSLKGNITKSFFPNLMSLWNITDHKRALLTIDYIRALRPEWIFLHFNELDHYQHAKGYMSDKAKEILHGIDSDIGLLLDVLQGQGMLNDTTIMITSDHGFENITGGSVQPFAYFKKMGMIPFPVSPFYGTSGGTIPIYLALNATQQDRNLVYKVARHMLQNPEFHIRAIYDEQNLAQLGGYKGAFLAMETDKHWELGNADDQPVIIPFNKHAKVYPGQHGFAPWRQSMQASFVIKGPGIKRNAQIGTVKLVDIAPTLAQIMKLNLGNNLDGRVLEEIFIAN